MLVVMFSTSNVRFEEEHLDKVSWILTYPLYLLVLFK